MGATAAQLEQARNLLAELALDQWRQEIAVRRLDDPAPQNVRWRLTELDLLDHAKNVLSSNPLSFFLLGWGRLRFSGTPDRAGQIVERFRRLGHRRLAIVGEPGMGKTTLAVLVLHELLSTAERGDAVPVLFTMSGWNPEEQSSSPGWSAGWTRPIPPCARSVPAPAPAQRSGWSPAGTSSRCSTAWTSWPSRYARRRSPR
ncbi:ATP-binding protein [Flindersiella endophytica]